MLACEQAILPAIDEKTTWRIALCRKTAAITISFLASYPDVVTVPQFRAMLGGIGESTALKLLREKRVQHYFIRGSYLIPKKYIVDYVLSTHYCVYRMKLKARI